MFKRLIFFVNSIWEMTCLFLFPSLLRKRRIIVDGRSTFHIVVLEPGLPLILSFGGLGDRFEFRNTLGSHSVNVIYLRDLSHQWYLNELKGVGNGVYEIMEFLRHQVISLKPSRVLALGTSAGGFAAILYGVLLKVDSICVFSPQTFRNKRLCLLKWDYRWLDRVIDIYNGSKLKRQFLDVKSVLDEYDGSLVIHYDKTNRLDNIHGSRIKGRNVLHVRYDFGGHNLVQALKVKGTLIDTVSESLNLPKNYINKRSDVR